MADKNETERQKPVPSTGSGQAQNAAEVNKTPDDGTETKKTAKFRSLIKSYFKWIIMTVVVIFCASAGFGLGRLFGKSNTSVTAEPSEASRLPDARQEQVQADSQNVWHYDLEPVVANLNEPGATRYIRMALTLQIRSELDQKKSLALIEQKLPLLRNWLTIYLASQTIEDIRGDKNLLRIQSQILDSFNEKLLPDAKPLIRNVFFKEFAVQ
jgi:flagellar basal body-associated protein FliL